MSSKLEQLLKRVKTQDEYEQDCRAAFTISDNELSYSAYLCATIRDLQRVVRDVAILGRSLERRGDYETEWVGWEILDAVGADKVTVYRVPEEIDAAEKKGE